MNVNPAGRYVAPWFPRLYRGYIITGAKAGACSLDNDNLDLLIQLHLLERHGYFALSRVAEGVPLLRLVEDDPAQRDILLVDNLFIAAKLTLFIPKKRQSLFLLGHDNPPSIKSVSP